MTDSAIRKYESGKVLPKVETLEKIAGALDCNIFDLKESITPPSRKERYEKGYADGWRDAVERMREQLGEMRQ